MKALTYMLKRTVINYFKRLREKPLKAVGPIFVVLWFLVMFLPGGGSRNTRGMGFDIIITIFFVILTGMLLYSLYSGTKKLDSKFSMCDVNFIFVSPIKPQTVLLYGVIKKIALELLASLYILYQIPNALRKFNVPMLNQLVLILAFILFQLVFCNILKLFIFALNTRYGRLGETIRLVIKVLLSCIAALIIFLIARGSIGAVSVKFINTITRDPWVGMIPVVGWMRDIAVQTIKGMNISLIFYFLLIILVSGLMLYITYNLKLDFYEDMLSGAEKYDAIKNIKVTKEGAMSGTNNAFMKPFKKRNLNLKGAYGARVLFNKHINEYMKRSLIFFINTYSAILLLSSVLLGIYGRGLDIKIIFLIVCGLLFFSAGMGGKIYNEIYHYFIFMLPDTPQRKLFYGMASALVKAGTDALLVFVPFGVLSRVSVFEIILCIVCYMCLAGMLSYSGLFGFRIAQFLGFTGIVAQGLLFFLFQLLLMVPLLIISIVLTAGTKGLWGYSIYLAFLMYSTVMSFLFSFACVGVFRDTEF